MATRHLECGASLKRRGHGLLNGLQQALLTGDEITAQMALDMGLVLQVSADRDLADDAWALATRIAQVPTNQLK